MAEPRPGAILLLSDGRPGHYRQSEGIAAALMRLRPASVRRIVLRPRSRALLRALGWGFASGLLTPAAALRLGYGLWPADLAAPETATCAVVSTGGRTHLANAVAARLLGAPNVVAGTMHLLPARCFSAILTPYEREAGLPRRILALKPSPVDPDAVPPPEPMAGAVAARRVVALLVGGPSPSHRYAEADWRALETLIASGGGAGLSFIVVTSPRTPDAVADRLGAAAAAAGAEFVDFRVAGPGSADRATARADAVACTEDSSSMIAEAVASRRPSAALAPAATRLRADEAEMLDALARDGLLARCDLAGLDAAGLRAALAAVSPLARNPLDALAEALAPELGWDPPPLRRRPS